MNQHISTNTINIDDAQAACLRLNAQLIEALCEGMERSNLYNNKGQWRSLAQQQARHTIQKLSTLFLQDIMVGTSVVEEAFNQALTTLKQDDWLSQHLQQQSRAPFEQFGKNDIKDKIDEIFQQQLQLMIKQDKLDLALQLAHSQDAKSKNCAKVDVTDEHILEIMGALVAKASELTNTHINDIQNAFFAQEPSSTNDAETIIVDSAPNSDDEDLQLEQFKVNAEREKALMEFRMRQQELNELAEKYKAEATKRARL